MCRAATFLIFTMFLWNVLTKPSLAESPILLTVSTPDTTTEKVLLTDEDLARLHQVSFSTSTIWTEGIFEFSGPSLASVLALLGVSQGNVILSAVNGYRIHIPWSVIEADAPIIAIRMNDEPFGIRQKGPIWIVFPYDSSAQYRQELIFALSVWQLTEILVEQ